jgi:hypothetical protein
MYTTSLQKIYSLFVRAFERHYAWYHVHLSGKLLYKVLKFNLKITKKVVISYFVVLIQNFPGVTEEDNKNLVSITN